VPKKRLIFVLLYLNGQFCISRNFRLQKVGNADWLKRNYNFSKVSKFIDELVILNVESDAIDQKKFLSTALSIASEVFVPVALGGAIRNLGDAEVYFHNGADKVVVNTLLWQNPDVVKQIANVYGEQALMASVDYRGLEGARTPHLRGEGAPTAGNAGDWLRRVASLGVGEILLNSVDRDGTGMGLDLGVFDVVPPEINLPFVLMGGVGRTDHFQPGLEKSRVSGVATSNLFAFIGKGLSSSRTQLLEAGMNMASWA
jgi:cyclase